MGKVGFYTTTLWPQIKQNDDPTVKNCERTFGKIPSWHEPLTPYERPGRVVGDWCEGEESQQGSCCQKNLVKTMTETIDLQKINFRSQNETQQFCTVEKQIWFIGLGLDREHLPPKPDLGNDGMGAKGGD
jgi:hypothetical protein